jgi:hypothetical protein
MTESPKHVVLVAVEKVPTCITHPEGLTNVPMIFVSLKANASEGLAMVVAHCTHFKHPNPMPPWSFGFKKSSNI